LLGQDVVDFLEGMKDMETNKIIHIFQGSSAVGSVQQIPIDLVSMLVNHIASP